MLSRSAVRSVRAVASKTTFVPRRGFQSTRARRGGGTEHPDHFFHYPEGPRSNLPFNPLTKFFWLRYWGAFGTAFVIPFGSAYWMTVKEQ